MRTLVLTVLGDDRPGIVESVAAVIADRGGSWDRSRMARLAGKFAGVVEATVPDHALDEVTDALHALSVEGELDIRIETAHDGEPDGPRVHLNLVGSDRPGIVHEISATMAALDVDIVELETATSSAPMAGDQLFTARAVLLPPAGVEPAVVRRALEDLANELMVEVELD